MEKLGSESNNYLTEGQVSPQAIREAECKDQGGASTNVVKATMILERIRTEDSKAKRIGFEFLYWVGSLLTGFALTFFDWVGREIQQLIDNRNNLKREDGEASKAQVEEEDDIESQMQDIEESSASGEDREAQSPKVDLEDIKINGSKNLTPEDKQRLDDFYKKEKVKERKAEIAENDRREQLEKLRKEDIERTKGIKAEYGKYEKAYQEDAKRTCEELSIKVNEALNQKSPFIAVKQFHSLLSKYGKDYGNDIKEVFLKFMNESTSKLDDSGFLNWEKGVSEVAKEYISYKNAVDMPLFVTGEKYALNESESNLLVRFKMFEFYSSDSHPDDKVPYDIAKLYKDCLKCEFLTNKSDHQKLRNKCLEDLKPLFEYEGDLFHSIEQGSFKVEDVSSLANIRSVFSLVKEIKEVVENAYEDDLYKVAVALGKLLCIYKYQDEALKSSNYRELFLIAAYVLIHEDSRMNCDDKGLRIVFEKECVESEAMKKELRQKFTLKE